MLKTPGPYIGLIREGTIKKLDTRTGQVRVAVDLAKADSSAPVEFLVPIPASWTGPNGEFSGGCPSIGATVWLAQGQGGRWAIVNYYTPNSTLGNVNVSSGISPFDSQLSALKPGRWLTQVKNNIQLYLDPKAGVRAGSPTSYIQLDPIKDIQSSTFKQQLEFSDGHRSIIGVIKRDQRSNSTRDVAGSALSSHVYDETLVAVGLDPITAAGKIVTRNPPFTEQHGIVYEFADSFGFTNDAEELGFYDNEFSQPGILSGFERRRSRADALSLSLVSPNYLIETISGTVVDVYGNVLDINRAVLPSGQLDSLSFRTPAEELHGNKSDVFLNLRAQTRKSIAYHFELNARKSNIRGFEELKTSIQKPTDYARDRSRFSIDIDKEGQFKINIPASSEVGNIPLLTRHENYSTLIAVQDDSDPRLFRRNKDRQDVFLEAFGSGAVSLTGGDDALDGYAAPVDRIDGKSNIKLGTAFHDIRVHSLSAHFVDTPVFWHSDNRLNNHTEVPLVTDVVSGNIIVSGAGANAGGRSGTISLDGFVSISIGANTIDRQSLWLDLAGGYVVNVGRDVRGRSYMGTMDGDVFLQIGATTIDNDSRFPTGNSLRDGVLDIRVVQGGNFNIIRIDSKGISIIAPGGIDIVSRGKMRLKSTDNDLVLDAKRIWFYADGNETGRKVLRKPGMSI